MHENYREIPSPLQAVWDVLDDHIATRPSYLRMVVRAAAFLSLTAILLGPYALSDAVGLRRSKRWIGKLWFRTCTALCGLTVTVNGTASHTPATIYAANHVSYLDIIALGALLDVRFIAKADVGTWPLFGFLARIANTLFVTRDRSQAVNDGIRIANALAAGDRLVLFPEGTSSNGRTVLPFKTSMFAAANTAANVQPVSIAYTHYADGRRLTEDRADLYAWYGDMTLFGHLMTVFGLRGANVRITFGQAVSSPAESNRKTLAKHIEKSVREGLHASFRA